MIERKELYSKFRLSKETVDTIIDMTLDKLFEKLDWYLYRPNLKIKDWNKFKAECYKKLR